VENCDVVSFYIVGPYTLQIGFADGTEHVVNLYPVLNKGVLRSLRDLSVFNQVHLDPETHNLVWPGDIGFDPEMLHNWAQVEEKLKAVV
jgi:hypothetical protein